MNLNGFDKRERGNTLLVVERESPFQDRIDDPFLTTTTTYSNLEPFAKAEQNIWDRSSRFGP